MSQAEPSRQLFSPQEITAFKGASNVAGAIKSAEERYAALYDRMMTQASQADADTGGAEAALHELETRFVALGEEQDALRASKDSLNTANAELSKRFYSASTAVLKLNQELELMNCLPAFIKQKTRGRLLSGKPGRRRDNCML